MFKLMGHINKFTEKRTKKYRSKLLVLKISNTGKNGVRQAKTRLHKKVKAFGKIKRMEGIYFE